MKGITRFTSGWIFFVIAAILAGSLLTLPLQLSGQTNTCSGAQGQNGVYNPTCKKGNPGVVGSSAFIDASMFGSNITDICSVLNFILNPANKIW